MADVGIAVVTGGAGGLGRRVTAELADRGLPVVIADADHPAAVDHVVWYLRSGAPC